MYLPSLGFLSCPGTPTHFTLYPNFSCPTCHKTTMSEKEPPDRVKDKRQPLLPSNPLSRLRSTSAPLRGLHRWKGLVVIYEQRSICRTGHHRTAVVLKSNGAQSQIGNIEPCRTIIQHEKQRDGPMEQFCALWEPRSSAFGTSLLSLAATRFRPATWTKDRFSDCRRSSRS